MPAASRTAELRPSAADNERRAKLCAILECEACAAAVPLSRLHKPSRRNYGDAAPPRFGFENAGKIRELLML